MSITIRQRISFDIKLVLSEEDREYFAQSILESAKAHVSGERPLDNAGKHLMRVALTQGEEALITECLRKGIIEALKEEMNQEGGTVSNFSFRNLKAGK